MADTSADSSNASNPEGIGTHTESNSPKQNREAEPVSSSSGIIAPGKLGNPFTAKSPGPRGEGDSSDGSSSSRSTPILRPSAFNPSSSTDRSFGTPFGSRMFGKSDDASSSTDSGKKSFILRPSALDKHTAALSPAQAATEKTSNTSAFRTSFKLEPAKMVNPFAKKDDDGDSNCSTDAAIAPSAPSASSTAPAASSSAPDAPAAAATETTATEQEPDSTSPPLPATNPLFQKAIAEAASAQQNSNEEPSAVNGGSFVFGENLADRVISAPAVSKTPEKNGTDEKEAAKAEEKEMDEAALPPPAECATPEAPKESAGVTLEESAAAEQAKQEKPSLQEVEVITGEEDESNVFHLNTKLFIFDKETQSWLERGRGQLRLNDMTSDDDPSSFQSRLVMRTTGNLRVVLNTKIWPDMTIERASPKSIRITAFDIDNNIKVFLIMTGSKDADQIFSAIDWRIQQLRVSCKSDVSASASSTGLSTDLKRPRPSDQDDNDSCSTTPKKQRTETDESTVDPETEVSSESFGSSTREFSSDA